MTEEDLEWYREFRRRWNEYTVGYAVWVVEVPMIDRMIQMLDAYCESQSLVGGSSETGKPSTQPSTCFTLGKEPSSSS